MLGLKECTTMPGSLTDIHEGMWGFCLTGFVFDRISWSSGWSQTCCQRMIPHSRSSCLYFPSAGITGMCHHILLVQCRDGNTPLVLLHTDFLGLLIEGHRKWLCGKFAVLSVSALSLQWRNESSMRTARWTWWSSLLINRSALPTGMPIGNKVGNSKIKS